MTQIRPQAGPQEAFLSSPADIVIYGGSAGGGKTFGLLLENARHCDNSKFGSVIFRRESTQITAQGGLWDAAINLYSPMGIKTRMKPSLEVAFKSGARVSFNHLQYDKDVFNWQGTEIPLISFDELTHFTYNQFFYMLSRNRSTCGVRPYMRATTNPDADSWVAEFISWWWNPNTGYAIPERSGVIRYFIRQSGVIKWADSRDEIATLYGADPMDAKSVTFISASIYDNRILLAADPGYLANLKAQSEVEQERLLFGNWKIKPAAGLYFKRSQINIIPFIPTDKAIMWFRYFDLAATEASVSNPSPDATASVLMGKYPDGRYIIADVTNDCISSHQVRELIKRKALSDRDLYGHVKIGIPQDPGQAGKDQAIGLIRMLSGYPATVLRETGNKVTRAEPFAAQWQAGNIDVLKADWNEMYFSQLEAFPSNAHDDMVDASSGAFAKLQVGAVFIA